VPEGRAQEAVLSALPFLALEGSAWVDELAAHADPMAREHVVVRL
jgi:hypothetical protein